MITTTILEFIGNLFMKIFSLVNIPAIDGNLLASAYRFLDTLFENTQLVGLFVRLSTIKWVAIILLIVYNYDHIINFFKGLFSAIGILKFIQ